MASFGLDGAFSSDHCNGPSDDYCEQRSGCDVRNREHGRVVASIEENLNGEVDCVESCTRPRGARVDARKHTALPPISRSAGYAIQEQSSEGATDDDRGDAYACHHEWNEGRHEKEATCLISDDCAYRAGNDEADSDQRLLQRSALREAHCE